jgi:hypothetical protein
MMAGGRRPHEDVGQIQVHVIQQIECLGAELEARALPEFGSVDHGDIDVLRSGTRKNVPPAPPGDTIAFQSAISRDADIPQWMLAALLSARMLLFQTSLRVAASRQRSSPSAAMALTRPSSHAGVGHLRETRARGAIRGEGGCRPCGRGFCERLPPADLPYRGRVVPRRGLDSHHKAGLLGDLYEPVPRGAMGFSSMGASRARRSADSSPGSTRWTVM